MGVQPHHVRGEQGQAGPGRARQGQTEPACKAVLESGWLPRLVVQPHHVRGELGLRTQWFLGVGKCTEVLQALPVAFMDFGECGCE